METLTTTVDRLKRQLLRVSNQRDYWRRKATRKDYERERKQRWREANPKKVKAALTRQVESGYFKRYYKRDKNITIN